MRAFLQRLLPASVPRFIWNASLFAGSAVSVYYLYQDYRHTEPRCYCRDEAGQRYHQRHSWCWSGHGPGHSTDCPNYASEGDLGKQGSGGGASGDSQASRQTRNGQTPCSNGERGDVVCEACHEGRCPGDEEPLPGTSHMHVPQYSKPHQAGLVLCQCACVRMDRRRKREDPCGGDRKDQASNTRGDTGQVGGTGDQPPPRLARGAGEEGGHTNVVRPDAADRFAGIRAAYGAVSSLCGWYAGIRADADASAMFEGFGVRQRLARALLALNNFIEAENIELGDEECDRSVGSDSSQSGSDASDAGSGSEDGDRLSLPPLVPDGDEVPLPDDQLLVPKRQDQVDPEAVVTPSRSVQDEFEARKAQRQADLNLARLKLANALSAPEVVDLPGADTLRLPPPGKSPLDQDFQLDLPERPRPGLNQGETNAPDYTSLSVAERVLWNLETQGAEWTIDVNHPNQRKLSRKHAPTDVPFLPADLAEAYDGAAAIQVAHLQARADLYSVRKNLPRFLEPSAHCSQNSRLDPSYAQAPLLVLHVVVHREQLESHNLISRAVNVFNDKVYFVDLHVDTHLLSVLRFNAIFQKRDLKLKLMLRNLAARHYGAYDTRNYTADCIYRVAQDTIEYVFAFDHVTLLHSDVVNSKYYRRKVERINRSHVL